MKAFEKLEKREERRREALARLDSKKPTTRCDKPEPPVVKEEPPAEVGLHNLTLVAHFGKNLG